MYILIKNVEVYHPEYLGKKDILICYDKIVQIDQDIKCPQALVIEKEGMIAIPGFIDQHIHITGGGGEGGFASRVPEVQLSELITGGITTVVGVLGTDTYTRSVENLLAKAKALNEEGITAYCLTGGYQYPSPTITGSVGKDITFINEIIGCKIAISDHRESYISSDELKRLVSEVRTSSMVANKCGIVTIHVGDDPKALQSIFDLLSSTSLPTWHFRPTHVLRTQALWESSLRFLEKGGRIDITIGSNLEKVKLSLDSIKAKNLNLQLVTFSSDGNGSYSSYDENGRLLKIGASRTDGIYQMTKYLIQKGVPISEALRFGTTNVATGLSLNRHKGTIKAGYDADILIVDRDFNLDTVMAKGKVMMKDRKLQAKGTYEKRVR